MEENPIFFADGNDPEMIKAYKEKAQETLIFLRAEQSGIQKNHSRLNVVSCVKTAFEEQDEETGEKSPRNICGLMKYSLTEIT